MNRRAFLGTLALLAAGPAGAAPPSTKSARVGRLSPLSASSDAPLLEALRQGLRELGWIEGRNLAIESRFADGRSERLPELARQLVRLRVDVIVAGSTIGAVMAQRVTTTLPIVMVTTGDPLASGLVASLARPGGNVTGMTALGQELGAKGLELLKEGLTGLTRVAVLTNPTYPGTDAVARALQRAAQTLGLQLHMLGVRDPVTSRRRSRR